MGAPSSVSDLPENNFNQYPNVQQKIYTPEKQDVSKMLEQRSMQRTHLRTETKKEVNKWDRAFDAVRALVPDWFLLTALIVGSITLGLVIIKMSPLRGYVESLLEFWAEFLKKNVQSMKSLIKRNP